MTSGALLVVTAASGRLLSHRRFLRLIDEHEPVRRHVLGRLATDALTLRHRLADAATLPAVARVARSLMVAGVWRGSQDDLARSLGLSRVTVNRALGRLARAKAVQLTSGGVRVADAAELAAYADPGPDNPIASAHLDA
jgi:CRP-like cAMP-binding protein